MFIDIYMWIISAQSLLTNTTMYIGHIFSIIDNNIIINTMHGSGIKGYTENNRTARKIIRLQLELAKVTRYISPGRAVECPFVKMICTGMQEYAVG